MTLTETPSATGRRIPAVDVARGGAIVAMAVYHAVWDLAFLRLLRIDLFDDPLWLTARTLILGSFLFLAGLSLSLAATDGLDRRRYLRRLGLLAAAAAGVSAMSYTLFPASPIFFGVLHHLTVASVLGLAVLRLPPLLTAALGVAVLVAGDTLALPLFDLPWLRWVGLMTFEPDSNDYVPIFPWFGIVLVGIAAGRLFPRAGTVAGWQPVAGGGRALAWMGRRALAIYLIHQPLLFGAAWLLAQALGSPVSGPVGAPAGGTAGEGGAFLASCISTCARGGTAPAVCERSCRCIADGFHREGLWDQVLKDYIRPEDQPRANAVVRGCL
ncbi:DUF1624 domain-containing protein [Azospirillum sp. RWY-5-1]|uniref:DUF1624 domain-containing protein n=1 Tax=Azospirillum oleiclasticum TaxID=2735135 RepID=A0ABX2TFF0_9PROT|nr:heparan-alpha-glucosaminide N-acetyltransferase [Azospirillum oleiclasticum]NYZ15121.1 DUF1624 domain-containing protein [Azospirillum oleiclasticum]NYZ22884.1 DUF1624 domain-containing protein [Azospirillum oleiclasticum]